MYSRHFDIVENLTIIYPITDLLFLSDFNLPHLNVNAQLNCSSTEIIFNEKLFY